MRGSRFGALLIALVLFAACESAAEPTEEGPHDVALAFVDAWNAEDFEAMHHLLLESPATRRWHSGALRVYWEEVLRDGMISDFKVSLTEIEVLPDEALAEEGTSVGYSITYESDAARRPFTLEGRLPIAEFQADWFARWRPDLPWPGYRRAVGFEVVQTWHERGALLDRNKKKLAAGVDASRRYPYGPVGGTTVGHLEPATRRSGLDRLVGASGLEQAYDEELAGEPKQKLVVTGGKEELAVLGRSAGEPSRPIRTTLDVRVQSAAEAAFGGTTGGAVVLDPQKGDILAAVASSPFDPNNYVGVADIEPFNRALSGLYPPGSSLKAMTASAALDTGEMKPSSTLTGPKEYRGVRNFESGEFGTLDFATALKYSVNTAFAQIALELGSKRLFEYSNRFGFNRKPSMALGAATSSFPKPLDEGDLMWGSIGQAQVLASPLHMATIAAAIANDGTRMEPRIDMLTDPTGERAIKQKTAKTMVELMRNVVIGGTGSAANITGLEVAGKTGTAEVDVGGERKNHAWFICFAPATDPKVAVAVVSEYGGVGGQVAAPLAASILTSVWPYVR